MRPESPDDSETCTTHKTVVTLWNRALEHWSATGVLSAHGDSLSRLLSSESDSGAGASGYSPPSSVIARVDRADCTVVLSISRQCLALDHSKEDPYLSSAFLAVDLPFLPHSLIFRIICCFLTIMADAPPGYNFAKAYGIDSVAGAVFFAILYVPFLLFFIKQAISRPTYVFIVIAFFSAGEHCSNF